MIIFSQLTLSIVVTITFLLFIRHYLRGGWLRSYQLAIGVVFYFLSLIVINLWFGVFEAWIIQSGLLLAAWFGTIIWLLPFVAPDIAEKMRLRK